MHFSTRIKDKKFDFMAHRH